MTICPWCGPGPEGQHTVRCWEVQRRFGLDPWGQPLAPRHGYCADGECDACAEEYQAELDRMHNERFPPLRKDTA